MEKLENKRINKYLDEIVQEVEAKAPILKRQREEFERSQKAVASLSAKLEQAMKVSIKGKKKSTKNMKKRKKKRKKKDVGFNPKGCQNMYKLGLLFNCSCGGSVC